MRFLFLVPAALFVAACSSGDVAAVDGGTEGGSDASSVDASADASDASSADSAADASQSCNTLANAAPLLSLDYVASAPPTGQGGTIVDGTYTMTAAAIYTGVGGAAGPTGSSAQVTIRIAGTTVDVVSKSAPPNDHLTTTLIVNGHGFTRTNTCPDNETQSGEFTATPTTFTVILPAGTAPDGGARTLVETFTKQ